LKTSEQKIALRVDVSRQIGTGHFMRCLTLADALREGGARTRFVSRHLPEYLRSKLVKKGHEFALINTVKNNMAVDELAHASWLGVSQAQDAADSMQALSDQNWDWLIVDHYALDVRWESMLRQSTDKILAIDDIADRQHDCDVLLDQNFYADMETRYAGKAPAHCQQLLGPRYALLRDEFRKLHEQIKPRRGAVKRVLIFFGGIDADNYTGQAINAMTQIDISDIQVDVVIGVQHPSRKQIEAECIRNGFNCYVQTDKMAELMAAADLAIGAGGSASWERCCLGLPCVVVAVALNQIQAAKDLSVLGVARYIGTAQEITMKKLRQEILEACTQGWLFKASSLGIELVDAQGVMQIIKIMGTI
jgi:UDP-2,4-diacetamido-2,4,6-trideoxy-beta-L-altropyranose hydrolase